MFFSFVEFSGADDNDAFRQVGAGIFSRLDASWLLIS
jgi:hypothetical protein